VPKERVGDFNAVSGLHEPSPQSIGDLELFFRQAGSERASRRLCIAIVVLNSPKTRYEPRRLSVSLTPPYPAAIVTLTPMRHTLSP
jgi:hypothetical protein